MRMLVLFVLMSVASFAGCTSQATRVAIDGYHRSSAAADEAFANVYRVAEEQMFLSTVQALLASAGPEETRSIMQAYATARRELEKAHKQYLMARALESLTVGTYLYDQQGALNVIFEDQASSLKVIGGAAVKARDAAGVGSMWDLVPDEIENDIRRRVP